MKGTVKEFQFSNLPKLTRASLALAKMFHDAHIDTPTINSILRDALKDIEPIFAEKLELALVSYKLEPKNRALRFLSPASIQLGGEFSQKNIAFAISINERAVVDLVYLLMGSDNDLPAVKTDLTPVEEGIFSFILSLVFNGLQKHLHPVVGDSIRLGPLGRGVPLDELFHTESDLLNFSLKIKIEEHFSEVNVLVSAPSVLSLLQNSPMPDEESKKIGLERASEYKIDLCVNAGFLALEPEQLETLRVDDIIILEEPSVGIDEKNRLSGKAICTLGEPHCASAQAELFVSNRGSYQIQITDLQPASNNESLILRTATEWNQQ